MQRGRLLACNWADSFLEAKKKVLIQMSKIPKVELRLARMKPVMLMDPDTKEPTSGYPAGRLAISLLRLSINAPSLMIGLPPLIPSRSAALPTRIPPLKRFPANDPNAAAPELANDPKPEARP
jgi:hypothetical protein